MPNCWYTIGSHPITDVSFVFKISTQRKGHCSVGGTWVATFLPPSPASHYINMRLSSSIFTDSYFCTFLLCLEFSRTGIHFESSLSPLPHSQEFLKVWESADGRAHCVTCLQVSSWGMLKWLSVWDRVCGGLHTGYTQISVACVSLFPVCMYGWVCGMFSMPKILLLCFLGSSRNRQYSCRTLG